MIAQPAKADWKNMYIKSFYASSYTAKTKIEGVNFGEPKEAQIENLGGQVDYKFNPYGLGVIVGVDYGSLSLELESAAFMQTANKDADQQYYKHVKPDMKKFFDFWGDYYVDKVTVEANMQKYGNPKDASKVENEPAKYTNQKMVLITKNSGFYHSFVAINGIYNTKIKDLVNIYGGGGIGIARFKQGGCNAEHPFVMQLKIGSEVPHYFSSFTPYIGYRFAYIAKTLYKKRESQIQSKAFKIHRYYKEEPGYVWGEGSYKGNLSDRDDLSFSAAYFIHNVELGLKFYI